MRAEGRYDYLQVSGRRRRWNAPGAIRPSVRGMQAAQGPLRCGPRDFTGDGVRSRVLAREDEPDEGPPVTP